MQINGIKTFKIDEVETTGGTGTSTTDTAAVEADLNDIFGDPATDTTSSSSGSAWIITDPTSSDFGMDGGVIDKLTDYPPDVEYVLAQNESAIRYLDVIRERYETTKEGLITLRDGYTAALSSVTPAEAAILQRKIELVNTAIAKCDAQIEKCDSMMDESNRVYVQEGQVCKDLNGDGWIMRPGGKSSIKVVYNDGKAYYMDANGNLIDNPFTDPEYEAKVIEGDSMTSVAATDAMGIGTDGTAAADLYFKLNELQTSYSGEYQTAVDIGVPEYIWVARDGDSWEGKIDEEADELKYEVDTSLWEGGVQKAPENKSEYVQVKVTDVVVESEPAIMTTDGDQLYHTVVKFLDEEGTTIVSFRIEGYFGSGPASAMTADGAYVAASSVGISFHNADRASPIIFDASKYESTCRHILDSFADTLGITDSEELSYQENKAAFEGDSFTTQYNRITGSGTSSHGTWADVNHDYDYAGYNDRYTPELPDETDSLSKFTTGVFVTGLRGSFTGSKHNDIFDIPDVNYTNDYIEAHTPDDAEPIRSGDPTYCTVIDGNSGNDVVRAGKGDLYAKRVSFAWVDACGDDNVTVSVPKAVYRDPDGDGETVGAEDTINADPKNFVRIHGAASSTVYDEGEDRPSENFKGYEDGYEHDDYYDLSGEIRVSYPANIDVVGHEELDDGNQAGDAASDWLGIEDEKKTPLEDAIKGIGEEQDNPFDAPGAWSTEYGYAAEQDELMDDFFSEMFGDASQFEMEIEAAGLETA